MFPAPPEQASCLFYQRRREQAGMRVLPKNEQAGCLFYQRMNKQGCVFYQRMNRDACSAKE
ncbi:MAG: hypothetical protein ACPGWR_07105 [Ardenticatenaceae bacterium]